MMCETIKYIIWGRELLKFWGIVILNATTLLQDNQAAIWQSKHDVKFDRNKHTSLKRAFCREKYEENIAIGQHQPRENLRPDILTHHNPKKQLISHIFGMGMEPVPDSLGDLVKGGAKVAVGLLACIRALLD
jgi:hypothetical protein